MLETTNQKAMSRLQGSTTLMCLDTITKDRVIPQRITPFPAAISGTVFYSLRSAILNRSTISK